ncbi:MAG: helix-turn-helix domain-containing protein [Archangium sp.]
MLKCLYSDGLDADETARVLGVNRQVVYNWQHRIRSLAREFQHG